MQWGTYLGGIHLPLNSFTLANPAHEELEHEEKFCRGDKILQIFQLVDPDVHQNGLTAKGLSSSKQKTKYEFKRSYLAEVGQRQHEVLGAHFQSLRGEYLREQNVTTGSSGMKRVMHYAGLFFEQMLAQLLLVITQQATDRDESYKAALAARMQVGKMRQTDCEAALCPLE